MTTPVATFSGLSSGMDTSGIISTMTAYAQKPITQLQNTEASYSDKVTSWQDFNSRLSSLQTVTSALSQSGTFNTVAGSSTNTAVASFTASAGATIGDHSLTVNQLAQAQKVVSSSQTSSSTALGIAGTFTLNGKSITTKATDTLSDISTKINQAGAGVTASVVNVSNNDYRLTLAGNATGTANAFAASDNSGGDAVLAKLGLVSGSTAIRQTVTPAAGKTAAASLAVSSATDSIATTMGLPSTPTPASGTVTINNTNVNIDLSTDSVTSIANKINAAQITGITAQVVSVSNATGSKQQLQIISSNPSTDSNGNPVTDSSGNIVPAAPQFGDSSNILATLGVVQQGFTNTISSAQDAKFNLDGLDMTRSSNVVSDAITSSTIKLLSGTSATPGSTTLSVAQNTDSVVSNVSNFVNAFNGIQSFITLQNQFTPASSTADGTTSSTNPLFGDSTLTSIQDQLTQALGAVAGSTTLQDIGITFDSTGSLNLDSSALVTALQKDPSVVANLFGQSGTASDSNVTFVSASGKTQTSAGGGYNIQISQAATQASGTAQTAQTQAASSAETLTFGGTQFSSPIAVTLAKGNTLQDTVNQINNNSNLNGKIYASIDQNTNKLVLSSQQYGSGKGFTISSDQTAGSDNSGIGSSGTTISDGTDVVGTINGEAATGYGRTLTGNSGNAHTDGLSLLISASPSDLTSTSGYDSTTHTATLGHVNVTHGVADALGKSLTQILDPTNGDVAGAEKSLNTQITDIESQITKLQQQVTDYTAFLQQEFSAMETRVSQLQAQGSAFSAESGSTSSTKKSS